MGTSALNTAEGNIRTQDYHKYGHNLELYNSKPSVAGCIFCNKLPNNIKQIENNNQFARELKKLLIKGCYYPIQSYGGVTSVFGSPECK
jgi:hypothetical protein